MKHKKIWLFLAIALCVMILSRFFDLNHLLLKGEGLEWLKKMVSENYVLSAVVYLVFTALSCVFLALPGVTFAIIAGILFGPWMGSLFCLIGTSIGAMLSFLAGRYFLKETFKPVILKNKALTKLLFTDKPENELTLLMITRLLPVFPFNLQNFAYGITDIGIVTYGVATFVFMIPGVMLFTLATSGIIDESQRSRLFFAVVAIALFIVLISKYAKRIYNKLNTSKDETYEK